MLFILFFIMVQNVLHAKPKRTNYFFVLKHFVVQYVADLLTERSASSV